MEIKPGTILVASPFHSVYLYRGSVILILDITEKGPVGVILNKPTHAPVCLVSEHIISEEPIMMGGFSKPENLSYIHRVPKVPHSITIADGIYWGGRYDRIVGIANDTDTQHDIRFFNGHVAWGPTQLQEEIKKGLWWVTTVDADTLFTTPDEDLWRNRCHAAGSIYSMFDVLDHPSIN